MFITIEGPEGSGKTTAVNYAVSKLEEMGYQIVRTREPGGTPIAEQIRNVILDKQNTAMDPRTEALLYAASRRQHLVEKVWPAIKEGKIVVVPMQERTCAERIRQQCLFVVFFGCLYRKIKELHTKIAYPSCLAFHFDGVVEVCLVVHQFGSH